MLWFPLSCDSVLTCTAEEQLKDDLNKAKELTRAGTDGQVSSIIVLAVDSSTEDLDSIIDPSLLCPLIP